MSNKSVSQSVLEECPTRVCYRSVLQERPKKVSYKDVSHYMSLLVESVAHEWHDCSQQHAVQICKCDGCVSNICSQLLICIRVRELYQFFSCSLFIVNIERAWKCMKVPNAQDRLRISGRAHPSYVRVNHCVSSLSKCAPMSAETVAKDRFGKLFRCKSNWPTVHQIWSRIELWSERLRQWKEDVVCAWRCVTWWPLQVQLMVPSQADGCVGMLLVSNHYIVFCS